jgi:hypothetical protein
MLFVAAYLRGVTSSISFTPILSISIRPTLITTLKIEIERMNNAPTEMAIFIGLT